MRTMNDGAVRCGCRCMLQLALERFPNRVTPKEITALEERRKSGE